MGFSKSPVHAEFEKVLYSFRMSLIQYSKNSKLSTKSKLDLDPFFVRLILQYYCIILKSLAAREKVRYIFKISMIWDL
jgi:hypothetical protein